MNIVGKKIVKHDAEKLLLGKPMFVDDFDSKDYLCIKVLRCPYANAEIEEIETSEALKQKGVEAIFTYKDVPNIRFTTAGQDFPEPSPHDRLILDKHLRFAGDAVAIIAANNTKCANFAMKKIKIKYKKLDSILDKHDALDNSVIVHPESNWKAMIDCGQNNKRNLAGSIHKSNCDIKNELNKCDLIIKDSFTMKAFEQVPFETFRSFAKIDNDGRLHITSSTQIIYHVQRIISTALNINKDQIVVDKLKVGGGFGTKQTVIAELYPAFVTWITKKPSKIIYTRKECMEAGSPRHDMEVSVTLGATSDGKIKAVQTYTLSDTGAYGEHGPTTAMLTYEKTIPMYSKYCKKFDSKYHVVYTNKQASGAYRGYGATQGDFAFECVVNQLAEKLQIDPLEFRLNNILENNMEMTALDGEISKSCSLDKCLKTAAKKFNWKEKYPVKNLNNNKVRSAGIAISMQGSSIKNVDKASVEVELDKNGKYLFKSSACDMGTGCETILSQILCETLNCNMNLINIINSSTDITPYDSGSYASSTTYLTGLATKEASEKLKNQILEIASNILNSKIENIDIKNDNIIDSSQKQTLSLKEVYKFACDKKCLPLSKLSKKISPVSPPPFMATMAEIEIDKETGVCEILDYVSVIDCGTTINPNLAKIQAEGGIAQAIGHTLYENKTYDTNGKPKQTNLMQYKIPSRLDINNIRVYFEESHEPTGPYGAKSVGELVVNGAAPAITHAIYRATGTWHKELPITPEKILFGIK